MRRNGFTLIEMIFVLLVMAIGTAMVSPLIDSGINAREARRAARRMAAVMHHLRGEAVVSGRPTVMRIDQNENSVETVGGGRWEVFSERAVIESVSGAIPAGEDVWDIQFFPNGSTTGGAITLANREDHRRNRWVVTLDPLVGSVSIQDGSL